MDVERLKAIADCGAAHGMLVSAVSNAYWAETKDRALDVLQYLGSIHMLAISCDAYHQQAIPFERVRNAISAAEKLDLPFNIAVCTENEEDPAYLLIISRLREIVEADKINTAVVFPAGRALEQICEFRHELVDEPPRSACAAGSSPIVFPDGKVIACIGPVIDLPTHHPLVLGNLRKDSLEVILDRAETNAILHAIRVWGPRKLISILHESNRHAPLPEKYVKDSVCCACYSLMTEPTTVAFLEQLAADVLFQRKIAYARVFYLQESRMAEILGLAS